MRTKLPKSNIVNWCTYNSSTTYIRVGNPKVKNFLTEFYLVQTANLLPEFILGLVTDRVSKIGYPESALRRKMGLRQVE